MDEKVTLWINGKEVTANKQDTILDVANQNGVFIPRLCYLKEVNDKGYCRLCSIKVEGQDGLVASCRTKVTEGMKITTDDEEIRDYVAMNLDLLAKRHNFECYKCAREDNCEFLNLLRKYPVDSEYSHPYGFNPEEYFYDQSDMMEIDGSKCVLCRRCVETCKKETGLGILNVYKEGNRVYVAADGPLIDSGCIGCGQCIEACPTGALHEKTEIDSVEKALRDKSKTVVVQVAPAVRTSLGEAFGYPIGTNVEGRMYTALRAVGFNEIMDTSFAADLTIMEEGQEFIRRIKNNGVLPMFTSCSPGWVNYLEKYYPEFIPNLSSCKSPQQMGGAMIKTYYAEKMNLDPHDIVSVAVMPCIAKKAEANRENMGRDGYRDVDYVLTTTEFARLIKRHGIDFNSLEPSKPFGELSAYTGAGVIFGATGGVMESALRTISDILENKSTDLDCTAIRGTDTIKEATFNIAGKDINVAVVSGGTAIKEVLEKIKSGEKNYHFVEFMGCSGGCINGGGQPVVPAAIKEQTDVRKLRASVLYRLDENAPKHKAHENEYIQQIYKEFLGGPCSDKSVELLHTRFCERGKN